MLVGALAVTRARATRSAWLLAALLAMPQPVVAAARNAHKPTKPAASPAPAPPPPSATPAAPSDSRPYDPQMLRLAELLGALTTMRQICGAPDAEQWRQRMQALLDTEGNPPARKDRLAGAYNRGLQSYAVTYSTCTPNARLVIQRFLDESSRLARDIGNRYRAS